jgi:hypothetical protein
MARVSLYCLPIGQNTTGTIVVEHGRQQDEQGSEGHLVRLRGDLGQVVGARQDPARDDHAEDKANRPDDVQHADQGGGLPIRTHANLRGRCDDG